MIDKLVVRNFKVLREIDLTLRPLTVIVGPNSSGKTTILQVLEGVTNLLTSTHRPIFGGEQFPEAVRSHISDGNPSVLITGHVQGEDFSVEVLTGKNGAPSLKARIGQEVIKGTHTFPVSKLYGTIQPAALINFNTQEIADPSYLEKITYTLPNNGKGLSSILANIRLEYPERFNALLRRLKEIIPTVEDLRLRPAYVTTRESRQAVGHELIWDMKGAKGLPARSASDGTLLTLGLLTILSNPNSPHLVLVDDLEHGLHPKALSDLVFQLRQIQKQDSNIQIVATSHSPYLLDCLEAEEILLTSLDDDGYAVIRPLSDHPEYEQWKNLMAPGEFWSTVGESWLTQKRSSIKIAE
jgi:energy-coupling factor transporter ATP-binding protein EcfA2